jgi:hypothetical protein
MLTLAATGRSHQRQDDRQRLARLAQVLSGFTTALGEVVGGGGGRVQVVMKIILYLVVEYEPSYAHVLSSQCLKAETDTLLCSVSLTLHPILSPTRGE